MKLTLSYNEAQDVIGQRYSFNAIDVEIHPPVSFDAPQPVLPSLNHITKEAIRTIYQEAYNAGCANALNKGNFYINKISLIKAVRTLTPTTSLKDGKEFVEDMMLPF